MMRSRWQALARVVLPVLLLNTLLTMGNRWPGLGIVVDARVSIELVLGVVALAAWIARYGAPSARMRNGVAAIASLWVMLRYIDISVPALLGRRVNVYWDTQHVWQLLRMAGADGQWGALAGWLSVCALSLVILFAGVRMLIGMLGSGLAATLPRRGTLAVAIATTAAWLAAPGLGVTTDRFFARPVSGTLVEQARMLSASISNRANDATLAPGPAFDGNLAVLAGADVLILFSEAYGAITFDAPHITSAVAASRTALGQAIAASGRMVVSARVRSPTFGGASWLAHAALLTGIDTANPDHYAALLTTRRPSLVSHFSRHGYRTVAWMPGIQRPWPEGSFYRFDRYADLGSIGYEGPAFGYWQVPDQAAMALLDAQELSRGAQAAQRPPRLVVFPTVTTHAPFRPVPPYVDDWARVTRPDGYTPAEIAAAIARPGDWTAPTAAYIESLRYKFEWIAHFLLQRADPDLVIILIGDHQPIGAVTGPGAPWDVPVHVISNNPVLGARLEAAGFVRGLEPPRTALGAMHELTTTLAEQFSAPIDDPPAAPGAPNLIDARFEPPE